MAKERRSSSGDRPNGPETLEERIESLEKRLEAAEASLAELSETMRNSMVELNMKLDDAGEVLEQIIEQGDFTIEEPVDEEAAATQELLFPPDNPEDDDLDDESETEEVENQDDEE